ncbi:Uncharacterised protein [Vibrio cholerae]|nr:Uncharacterised protein [Vibrio cholerae]
MGLCFLKRKAFHPVTTKCPRHKFWFVPVLELNRTQP